MAAAAARSGIRADCEVMHNPQVIDVAVYLRLGKRPLGSKPPTGRRLVTGGAPRASLDTRQDPVGTPAGPTRKVGFERRVAGILGWYGTVLDLPSHRCAVAVDIEVVPACQ